MRTPSTNTYAISTATAAGINRFLAGSDTVAPPANSSLAACHDPDSFLGVGNATCLGKNWRLSAGIIGLIIVMSFGAEHVIHYLKHSLSFSLVKIVDKITEELMVLGFISMTFFAMNTWGFTRSMATVDGVQLDQWELWHFLEFFHYLIFIVMMFYISIVCFLVSLSNLITRLWESTERAICTFEAQINLPEGGGQRSEIPLGNDSSVAFNVITRTYAALKSDRRLLGWKLKLQPTHWYEWFVAVHRMGYALARQESSAVYEDRELLQLVFEMPLNSQELVNFPRYTVFATRALLTKILEVHWGVWLVLICFFFVNFIRFKVVKTELFATGDGVQVILVTLYVGLAQLFLVATINYKVFHILKGLVNDRVQVHDDGFEYDQRTKKRGKVKTGHHSAAGAHNEAVANVTLERVIGVTVSHSTRKGLRPTDGAEDESSAPTLMDASGRSGHDQNEFSGGGNLLNGTSGRPLTQGAGPRPNNPSTAEGGGGIGTEEGHERFTGSFDLGIDEMGSGNFSRHPDTSNSADGDKESVGRFDEPLQGSTPRGGANRSDSVVTAQARTLDLLQSHLSRFWFSKPKLLLHMLQFMVFFQAIYLAFISLVLRKPALQVWGGFGLVLLLLPPVLILCVFIPMVFPSLELALDLVGYIGADKLEKIEERNQARDQSNNTISKNVNFCPFCGSKNLERRDMLRCLGCNAHGFSSKVRARGGEQPLGNNHKQRSKVSNSFRKFFGRISSANPPPLLS